MTGKVLTEKRKPLFRRVWQNRALYLMLMIPLTVLILFRYVPMYGIQIAFKDYMPSDRISESPWVGLRFISRFISNYKFLTIMKNTLVLGAYGIATFPCALLLALSVHYLTSNVFRKLVQTICSFDSSYTGSGSALQPHRSRHSASIITESLFILTSLRKRHSGRKAYSFHRQ